MDSGLWGLIGGVIVALITWATTRGAHKAQIVAAKAATEPSMVSELWERIAMLEARLDQMQAQLTHQGTLIAAAGVFIDQLGAWLAHGAPGRPPRPPSRLYEIIDPRPWVDPTERTHDA